MSKISEQTQADLDRVDAAEKGWQEVVERLNQQLAKASPSQRIGLRLELENAKVMLGDLPAVRRVVAAGVPFDELKLPDANRARNRKQRDGQIQRQFLRWEQAAREKVVKAERQRVETIK